jgi:hypothetical protein
VDPQAEQRRRDGTGLRGYACLGLLAGLGWLGGLGLLFAALAAYMRAADQSVARIDEAYDLTNALEKAVVLCGFGALALLVGVVATVVLIKELGDDAARASRGPV